MSAIETPCKKICVIDPMSMLCRGCGRTRQEIGYWTIFSDADRHRIMQELPERIARHGLGEDVEADTV